MMYLQWLVHGRPDAPRPATSATRDLAKQLIDPYHQTTTTTTTTTTSDKEDDWDGAVQAVSDYDARIQDRVLNLGRGDWYRLRRTLEVVIHANASTDSSSKQPLEQLFTGERSGGLDYCHNDINNDDNDYDSDNDNDNNNKDNDNEYDTRCFFLCPTSRWDFSHSIDVRCEQMITKGLIQEVASLYLDGKLPVDGLPSKSIGYRQTLQYLLVDHPLSIHHRSPNDGTTNNKEGDIVLDEKKEREEEEKAFDSYFEDFKSATRKYAKKQMQWFRKDERFLFVPVNVCGNTSTSGSDIDDDDDNDDECGKTENNGNGNVNENENGNSAVTDAADMVAKLCSISRDDFELELNGWPLPPRDGDDDEEENMGRHKIKKQLQQQQQQMTTDGLGKNKHANRMKYEGLYPWEEKKEKEKENESNGSSYNNNNSVLSLSSRTRLLNERQAVNMKFYRSENTILGRKKKRRADVVGNKDGKIKNGGVSNSSSSSSSSTHEKYYDENERDRIIRECRDLAILMAKAQTNT